MGLNRLSMTRYSPDAISILESTLLQFQKDGRPKYYEIFIDDCKVVPKTKNPVHFGEFHNGMTGNTEYILINLYQGESRHKDQYVFYIHQPPDKEKLGIRPDAKTVREIHQYKVMIAGLEEKLEKAKKAKRKAKKYIEYLEETLRESGVRFEYHRNPFFKRGF